jgi:hypothetical protein
LKDLEISKYKRESKVQRYLLLLPPSRMPPPPPPSSSSLAATAAAATTTAAIALKFHPKHVSNKQNETHYENITHFIHLTLSKVEIPPLEYYTIYPKTTNFICNY